MQLPRNTIGTLRNEDLAIGRRLLLRHLITTSWQKESLYFDPYGNDEDGSRNMPWSSEQVGLVETVYDGFWFCKTIQSFPYLKRQLLQQISGCLKHQLN